jgi:hypothetical protein
MSIRDLTTSVAAFVLAALTPAMVVGGVAFTVVAFDLAVPLALLAFFISVGHALVLGLLLFVIFRSRGWINVMSCITGGAIVGAIPGGLLSWPFRPGNGTRSSFNGAVTIVDGIPTAAGWLSYIRSACRICLLARPEIGRLREKGYPCGRRLGHHAITRESRHSIDLARLHRRGMLQLVAIRY